ncbi:hypothetical protein [Paenibacillus sp. FSL H7-0714]|uniref:hypothetical protein n=2 Tax=unclassified Paenibacillus TaxID=185978 RepID=UPI00404688E4
METAPPLQMSLDVVMADKEQLWNKMIEKHRLARHSYKDVSSWLFGDLHGTTIFLPTELRLDV